MKYIYIVSKDGRVPTDASINRLCEKIFNLENSKKSKITYKCGSMVNDPDKFLNEYNNLTEEDGYNIMFIENAHNIHILGTDECNILWKILKEKNTDKQLVGEIIHELIQEYL